MTEKFRIPRRVKVSIATIFGVILLGCLALFFVRVVIPWSSVPRTSPEQRQDIVMEYNGKAFEYRLVPDAENRITVPAPYDARESDQLFYESVKSDELAVSEGIDYNYAYNLPFKDSTYSEHVNRLSRELRYKIFQMNDELAALTKYFNTIYPNESASERVTGIVLSTDLAAEPSYPPLRAVEAYAAVYVMSTIDSKNADQYERQGEQLVTRDISYGRYTKSDAEIAKSVVTQYTDLASDSMSALQSISPSAQ